MKISYFINFNLDSENTILLIDAYLNNKIATGLESDHHTGMILIDLQKAFDTINHQIVISKMEYLG